MFSEYASRIVQHSQSRLAQNRNKPLFYSTNDEREDIRESMALRQSRAGVGSRFGAFNYSEDLAQEQDDEDAGHDAMRSSWVPPPERKFNRPPIMEELESAPVDISSSVESAYMESQDRAYDSDSNELEETDEHNEAPDDIMFGVPLNESIPPRSLAGSPTPPDHSALLEDSITGKAVPINDMTPAALDSIEPHSSSHDRACATLFIICQASIVSTSLFVFLTTESPTASVTDSIYAALTTSMPIILRDILIASIVAGIWLGAIKLCIRPVLYIIVIVVPMAALSLSTSIIRWSYKGTLGGFDTQARAMRWSGVFIIGFACMWIYTAYTRRFVMLKTVSIIKLSCTILEHNLCLLTFGIGSLILVVCYALIWLHQFERIFLRGAFTDIGSTSRWVMQGNSWFLGAYFVWMFLWTIGVISGVQRAATSAAVSHWYFHRHDLPKTTELEITRAAVTYSMTTSFGSACATSLYALMTRIPLIVLPRRMSSVLSLGAYWLLSAPIISLTNPLTLSYAAILSIDIGTAAKSIHQNAVLNPANPWTAYRTAKMLLSAARATTALGLGTAAWISAARASDGGASLYGYVVGLMAAVIGWAVVGSIEGMVSMITDACFVCYGIDFNTSREGRSHCLEAVHAFGSGQSRNEGALQV